jgi:SAM-dependent methyltransferase
MGGVADGTSAVDIEAVMTSNAYALSNDSGVQAGAVSATGVFSRQSVPITGAPVAEHARELSSRSHQESQGRRYDDFYSRRRKLRRLFRFDVRYRCRRLQEVLRALSIPVEGQSVLDYGFGGGDLLASFPQSCRLHGVDISASAAYAAATDPRFSAYAEARFECIAEDEPGCLTRGPFDLVLSSHVLEHVPDDEQVLRELRQRLKPSGYLAIFVPIEEPDYIPFHVRNYSLQSISTKVRHAGFELCHVEGSMQINGHLWKLLTIPSRRRWPVVGPLVDALRLGALSAIPYRGIRFIDGCLHYLGFGPRQALVVAKRRG